MPESDSCSGGLAVSKSSDQEKQWADQLFLEPRLCRTVRRPLRADRRNTAAHGRPVDADAAPAWSPWHCLAKAAGTFRPVLALLSPGCRHRTQGRLEGRGMGGQRNEERATAGQGNVQPGATSQLAIPFPVIPSPRPASTPHSLAPPFPCPPIPLLPHSPCSPIPLPSHSLALSIPLPSHSLALQLPRMCRHRTCFLRRYRGTLPDREGSGFRPNLEPRRYRDVRSKLANLGRLARGYSVVARSSSPRLRLTTSIRLRHRITRADAGSWPPTSSRLF